MTDTKDPVTPTKEQIDNKDAEETDQTALENDCEKGDNETEKSEKNENEENEKNTKAGSPDAKKKIKKGDAEAGEYTEEELAELEAIEKENKNDCYYVLLAIVLGLGLFGVLVYFSVQSFFHDPKVSAFNATVAPVNVTMMINTTSTTTTTVMPETTTQQQGLMQLGGRGNPIGANVGPSNLGRDHVPAPALLSLLPPAPAAPAADPVMVTSSTTTTTARSPPASASLRLTRNLINAG